MKKVLEKQMLKVTRTTGRYRTHGARAGETMALSSSKSKMAMVFVALIRMEFTGLPGTTNRTVTTMILLPDASLILSLKMTRYKSLKTFNMVQLIII